ncbi:MAG TPA: HAMP domain-containing protein, partial [Acidimicrobiales bacterium]|nr:HAMP domain-containing protein [Acidimicrobiales bacterium]
MPIRIKLLGALAVPLLGLLSIIVFELAKTSRDVREVRSQTHLATATIGPAGLLSSLQDERSWAVAELSGTESSLTLDVTGYAETQARTDEALAAFRSEMEERGGDIAAVYRPALAGIGDVTALRQEIDAHNEANPVVDLTFADQVFDRYAELTTPFLDANTRLALAIDSPGLRQGAELIDLSSRQIETTADLVRALIQGGASGTIEERDELIQVATLTEVFELNSAAIKGSRREPYDELVDDEFPEKVTTDLLAVADVAIAGERVDANQVLAAVNVPIDQSYIGFRTKTADLLVQEADSLKGGASGRGWLFRLFALVAVVFAGLAVWWVSRSITRPLRALTRQATDMANHRLPDAVLDILDTPLGDDVTVPQVEPISVQTRDEVADVADALNTVQDSALDLAVEQAVLRRNIADSFVNLGRRNQNLLGRQLDFITELEHNETDPDTLANLFRLDHLATRMRRNAESLLVLAGIDPPRKWAAPVR